MGTLQNNFSWSKSRDEKFRECPRQYYFHHYGSWGGWDVSAEPRVREIYILKNLKSRQMWLGEVVHHAVENALKHYQQNRELPADAFLSQMTQRMRSEFRESRGRRYRETPGKVLGLYEHEYEKEIPDEKWVEIHETARRCFSTFANIVFLQRVKPIPVEDWKLIETMQTFNFEGTLIYVKIDFCYQDPRRPSSGVGSRLVIVDWKTGKSEDVDNEIQLDCYGLFSRDYFHVPTESIETVESNVNSGQEKVRSMIEAKLDFAKHYIRNSIAGMKRALTDPEQNLAREEGFPFTENERTCRFCFFKKVCPKWA